MLAMGLGVLFNRQQGWLLRGPFCSIASRAGSYEGRFVPSPAGVAPTRAGGLVGGRVSGFGRLARGALSVVWSDFGDFFEFLDVFGGVVEDFSFFFYPGVGF